MSQSPGNAYYAAATDENDTAAQIQPRRLELSLNPENGSLLTAPLMSVLLAATDGLYSDLYSMIQGEIDVTTAIIPTHAEKDDAAAGEQNNDDNENIGSPPVIGVQTKRERMAKLSFAERRHELSWRLAANGRSLQHVAALCGAAASSQLAEATSISSRALQHTRTAWVQADEAQDALFFFHAQLFPGRAAPHDVYGAADIICSGHWYDLPRDLLLTVDRYETSKESMWSRTETDRRWQLAVRDKLIMGEVGWMRRQLIIQKQNQHKLLTKSEQRITGISEVEVKEPLWKASLRGGIVKLTHGKPKVVHTSLAEEDQSSPGQQSPALEQSNKKYPIECLLTVFPNPNPDLSEWTLLSIDIHVKAKTGEFNHQLETSNRQRYDLHRLAALAMSREEGRVRRERANGATPEKEGTEESDNNKNVVFSTTDDESNLPPAMLHPSPPARPLHALFQVAHTFALSWQLELLSAQAQALRRGVWAAADSNLIQVTPVRFLDDHNSRRILGVLSISFWKVDDAYGPPFMGDISLDGEENTKAVHDENTSITSSLTSSTVNRSYISSTSQLTLSIRAEVDVGIRVALSGASSIMEEIQGGDSSDPRHQQLCSTVRDLLENASNPISLSASDSLLAATKLCAELKCQAVVEALQPKKKDGAGDQKFSLPPWIHLTADRGSISVAARIRYHGIIDSGEDTASQVEMPILFQMKCDARTGSFVNTFSRSMHVLRRLAGNDVYYASEPMAIRISSLPQNRRRAAGAQSSLRMVRDAFDGLIRSMNLLGQRAGVGGNWDNIDDKSSYLRDRANLSACLDVRSSLIRCCGMTALYGLSPLAFGTALGIDAVPDMAGDAIENIEGFKMLAAPPISILLDQQLVETSQHTSDGVNKKSSHIDQSLFSITCSVNDDALTLYPLDVSVKLDSISSVPQRKKCSLIKFNVSSSGDPELRMSIPPAKRQKQYHLDDGNKREQKTHNFVKMVDVMEEVTRFAEIVSFTMDCELEDDEVDAKL